MMYDMHHEYVGISTHFLFEAQTIGCFIRPATGVPAPQMYGRNNYPSHYSLRRPYYRHIPAVLKCRFRLFEATFDIQSRKVKLGQGLYWQSSSMNI